MSSATAYLNYVNFTMWNLLVVIQPKVPLSITITAQGLNTCKIVIYLVLALKQVIGLYVTGEIGDAALALTTDKG